MKELSIDEKAKAYDEAIKVAKSKIKNDKDHVLYEDDIIEIFPKLKELEDEKIRKTLIGWVNIEPKESFENGFSKEEILTWLEKQGDNIGISEATKQKLEDNLNKALEQETPESWNKFLDEQGEQKPVNTVESRFKINDNVIHKETGKIWTIHWYLSDTNSYYVIDEEKLIHHYTEDVLESAEQEDSNMLQSILDEYKSMAIEKRSWLKSLKDRYTWKPSDEQIEALDEVYKTHCANNVCRRVLFNLMNDLKKLKA